MAHITQGKMGARLRYRITLPYTWLDRSRRYKKVVEAKRNMGIASEIERKTKRGRYGAPDIELWRVSGLINRKDHGVLAASIGLGGAEEYLGSTRFKEIRLNAVNDFISDMVEFNPEKRDIPKTLRLAILARDKSACQNCGRTAPLTPLHIDHIIPYSSGGKTTPYNLQTVCRECNLVKKNTYSFPFNKQKINPYDYGYEV